MVKSNAYEQRRNCIKEQVEVCEGILGKEKRYISLFLEKMGVLDIKDITPEIKTTYRMVVDNDSLLSARQRQSYRNALEQIQSYYYKPVYAQLYKDITNAGGDRGLYKLFAFLAERGIGAVSEITFSVRMEYKRFIEISTQKAHRYELINLIDRVKLNNIKELSSKSFGNENIAFSESEIYLPYWPEYAIAYSFYHANDKEAYVYDFSVKASMVLKQQVFSLLEYVLKNNHNSHDRNLRFLRPLAVFYRFCCENGIQDVAMITAEDVARYKMYIPECSESYNAQHPRLLS